MTREAGTAASVYLCAPVNALVEGIYEENIPLSRIREHGDFGLGTYDDLDGEMVLLDGRFYRIAGDGSVHEMDDRARSPFACVSFFSPTGRASLDQELSHDAFEAWLLRLLPSPNLICGLRVEGRFTHVKVRSVTRQEHYRPLVEAASEEQIFRFAEADGTLAGFYTPQFLSSLNVPGLHLHFLSDDRHEGGHLLECRPLRVRVEVQVISSLELALPLTADYLGWDFRRDVRADLGATE